MVEIYKSLDFDKLLKNIAFFAKTEKAKIEILDHPLFNEKEIIENKLNEIDELINFKKNTNISFDFDFKDISNIIDFAKKGSTLSIQDIIDINTILISSINNKNILNLYEDKLKFLSIYKEKLLKETNLSEYIKKNFISSNEISSKASQNLEDIRKKIDDLNDLIRKTLISYTKKSKYSLYLQSNIYTVKNDRYCIPVKTEYKRMIPGIVHEQSNTKSTTYIEPFEILETNNLLKELYSQEKEEIVRILKNITKKIINLEKELLITQDTLVTLDIINAKTDYSIKFNAIKPKIVKNRVFLQNAKHPLIDKKKVVPITVQIDEDKPILVISGHNTGGKTATLKLIGLSALSLKIAMFIESEIAELPIYSNIFLDIGDDQSIENELSTFSSHIINIKDIIKNAKKNDLILLDELAMGTDPEEGSAIACAIFEYLLENKITTIITTHYKALKEKAKNEMYSEVATMEYDSKSSKSTYKLIKGHNGLSNAILIAQKLGLQSNIIKKAEKFLPKDFLIYKQALKEIELLNYELNQEKEKILQIKKEETEKLSLINKQIDLFEKEKEKFEKSIENERAKKVDKLKEEAEKIVEELKKIKTDRDNSIFKAFSLNKKIQNISTDNKNTKINRIYDIDDSEISIGDTVIIKKLDQQAQVENIKGNKLILILDGGIKISQNKNDVIKIKKQLFVNKTNKINKDYSIYNINATSEINIIGSTANEVADKLSKFLDDALFSGLKSVRIIHGKGTGILRKAVHEYLKTIPYIKSFNFARELEGDTGVTEVQL